MKKFLIISILIFFCWETQAVVINEIAWMGTTEQWQNEWIELYNPGETTINLDNWILKTKDDSPFIELSGIIGSMSYFLLERTDDTTLPDIKADLIYKGGLNNQGEHLLLLNNSGKLIDEIDCSLSWFAGQNETKKTMERIDSSLSGSDTSNWKTSSEKDGTPKAENSEEKEVPQKQIISAPQSGNYSGFSFVLIPGIALSLFSSMLVLGCFLKIKQKKNNIKNNIKV